MGVAPARRRRESSGVNLKHGLCAAAFVVGAFASDAHAGDVNAPHPHQGVLAQYSPRAPLSLTAAERTKLNAGEVLERPFSAKDARPTLVFLVKASPATTWKVVTDVRRLPTYVEEVKKVEIVSSSGTHIIAKLTMGQMGFSAEEFCDYDFRPEREGTWHLDYSKRSDLDDSVGFWRVTAGDADGTAIVEYSADVKPMSWAPGFFAAIINDKALHAVPAWVRQYSEAAEKAEKAAPKSPTTTPSP